jgi:hypothetical protein
MIIIIIIIIIIISLLLTTNIAVQGDMWLNQVQCFYLQLKQDLFSFEKARIDNSFVGLCKIKILSI